MTITQLRVLLAVLEDGSFAAAGERLAMSQSAVSHALAALERELGGPLVTRGAGRSPRPTELGALVVDEARAVIGGADRIAERASSYIGLDAGRVRIGSIESIASRHLPNLLARFRARHPRIDVGLLEGSDAEIREWLLDGVADVGFLAAGLDGLETEPFVRDTFAAVLPAGHPLASRSNLTAADLAGEPFVMSKSGCEPLVLTWFGATPPRIEYEVRTVDAMIGFIREGLGVSLLPGLTHPDDRTGLEIVPVSPRADRQVVVARAAERPASPATARFVRMAVEFGERLRASAA